MADDLYWRRLRRDIEATMRADLRARCDDALRRGMAAKAHRQGRERLKCERLAQAAQPRSNVLAFTPRQRPVLRPSPQLCFDFEFALAPVVPLRRDNDK